MTTDDYVLVEQFGDGDGARFRIRDSETQRVILDDASRSEVLLWALRRLPLRDLLNEHAVSLPPDPDAPRVDVSDWSVRDLTNAMIGPLADSAIEELVRRANAERKTVADVIYDDIRRHCAGER